MKQYKALVSQAFNFGVYKEDRTGTGTYSLFGHQMRFDLSEGFPLVTLKKCHLKSIIHELLWFLQGDTNIRYLQENGVSIWNEWADENGELGPVYGYQWRSWPAPNGESIDQITNLINMIKSNPDSRRLIVSAWNPALVDQMALPPCHAMFQFYSAPLRAHERKKLVDRLALSGNLPRTWREDRETYEQWMDAIGIPTRALSCQLYQRSADIFLGVPFNIASYALLTMMVAQVTGHALGAFIWTGGDCQLYSNHLEQARLLLSRQPRDLPQMKLLRTPESIFDFKYEDFELTGYDPHPAISAPVAV